MVIHLLKLILFLKCFQNIFFVCNIIGNTFFSFEYFLDRKLDNLIVGCSVP